MKSDKNPLQLRLFALLCSVSALIIVLFTYLGTPEISLASAGFRAILFSAGCVFLLPFAVEETYENSAARKSMQRLCLKVLIGFGAMTIGLSLYYTLASFSASYVESQAKAYAGLIGNVQEREGSELPALDIEKANLVTEDIAMNRAMKKLSEQEVAAIGSQYTVGSMHKQIINGELRWVGYLEPRGFFRWFLEDGAPGYVSVSASDETDAQIVTKLEGKEIAIRRGSSHWFNQQVERAFWLSHPAELFYRAVPELDDQGRPHWVTTTFSREVSNDGLVVSGVLVMDAQSGKVTRYSVKDVPSWVDQVYPAWHIKDNIDNYGEFKSGAWNFANEGKLQVQDIDMVYGTNNRSTLVASISAMGKNSTGLFGFMVADTQTGEVQYYGFTAVEESEAARAVLGSLPKSQLDYSISNPRPYLVNGIPTYVAMAYTGVGANKQYAFAAIDNPQRVAVRGSMQAAYQAYLALPSSPSQLAVNSDKSSEKELTTTVKRIAPVGKGYQILLEGDDTIYTADAEILIELGLTQPGDKVRVTVTSGNALQGSILTLDNLEFGPKQQTDVKQQM